MAAQTRDGIDKFRSWVQPIVGAYPSLEIRSLAYLRGIGASNLYTKATLCPAPPERRKSRRILAHPSFRIAEDILPSKTLLSLLDGLAKEVLLLPDVVVSLSTPDIDQNRKVIPRTAPISWNATRDNTEAQFWDGRSASAAPVRRYTLSSYGGAGKALVDDNEWDELDACLVKQRPRWLGIPDVVSRFLRVDHQWTINHSTEIMFELPLLCELGPPQILPEGRLSVQVLAPSRLRGGHLRVSGLMVSSTGSRWATDAPVRPASAPDDSGRAQFESILRLSGASSVTLHLLLNDRVVAKAAYDLWTGRSPNYRMAALASLGEAVGQMEAVLRGDESAKKDAEGLEIAVANLMAVAGFVNINAGRKHAKSGEAVDIVAMHPLAPIVFCIECTLGPAGNKEKLAKLEMRTRDLSRVLQGFTVKGVGVVAREESSPADVTESAARGVILINRTHLRALRAMVQSDSGPSAIAKWLMGNKSIPGPKE